MVHMKVVLHNIERRDDGLVELTVRVGGDPPKQYSASYDGSRENDKFGGTDQELFFALSDLAHRRYGNCAVYQMELMGILGALDRGDDLPKLPVTLGTTSFCTLLPSRMRVVWNKFKIRLYEIGLYRPKVWGHPDYRNVA